jgi:hypothetical protein
LCLLEESANVHLSRRRKRHVQWLDLADAVQSNDPRLRNEARISLASLFASLLCEFCQALDVSGHLCCPG